YRQQANEQQRQNTENQLMSLFEKAWKDYKDANRRVDLYGRQTNLARQSLDVLKSQYSTNTADFEEVLRMERKLLKYKLELEKARADQQSANALIYFLMGR
ncbi:MAG: TolC family protein, partial [Bacteroidales bacterium]|nr:TolC family protein [Bacteroidales bacterium]